MNGITKTFIVLLVVVSLLSAAGFIVFVNQVQNFKVALADSKSRFDQSQATVTSAKAQAASVQAQLDAARRDNDLAQQENARLASENADKVAQLMATIANDQSTGRIAAVSLDNATAALTASEAQRKTLGDALAQARTEGDQVNHQKADDEIAISDLTNKLDVANRKVADLSEQYAQAKSDVDHLQTVVREHGWDASQPTDRLTLSVPPIDAVVRQASPINGIPYATISVGSAEKVQKGMVFHVVDRTRNQFLGDLTIDSVDLHEATGKLDGPNIAAVQAGMTAKTQL